MNLIAYSDSEGSDDEGTSIPQPAAKPAASKPAFQKVVDRSNPGKIKLNLPGTSQPQPEKDHLDSEAPPAKRARLGAGSGAFSGFNAMLPAPKKPKLDAGAGASSSSLSGKRGAGKGLGAGVNLRTGAEPAFRREPRVDMDEYDENGNPIKKEPMNKEEFRAMLNLPTPKSEKKASQGSVAPAASLGNASTGPSADAKARPSPTPETKPIAARPKFMPMSVARGKKKPAAKPAAPSSEGTDKSSSVLSAPSSTSTPQGQTTTAASNPTAKPKVSLFSISSHQDQAPKISNDTTPYQPLLYGARPDNEEEEEEDQQDASFTDSAFTTTSQPQSQPTNPPPNSLTSIASELNLSASERRQLFGRHPSADPSSTSRLVEFNTDTEYAHNEHLRQQGETVQQNVLKPISGTGKNSLKSLVNVASTQKDALEDHFAEGRRNKREAGGQYGW
ncbi:unnamed protein product [Periconia digitata]|uniref:Mitotic checkpoint regulator, MAD2B-interacting-domain-containing protein n=1 Tax=Periconia digitata TaxID=1303443 RepID=A0A9W4UMB8_9PLEO|nr:unnamed protein product [Periconia digitata]